MAPNTYNLVQTNKELIFAEYGHELTLLQGYDTLAWLKTDQVLELNIVKYVFFDPSGYQNICSEYLGSVELENGSVWIKSEQQVTEMRFKHLPLVTIYDNFD